MLEEAISEHQIANLEIALEGTRDPPAESLYCARRQIFAASPGGTGLR